MEQASFLSSDGLKIVYRKWMPTGLPAAILIINHGFNSHGGQYVWPAEAFSSAGFVVYAIDMRGRGQSEGRRLFVNDVAEYVGDLHQLVLLAKADYPDLPAFLLGHSVGGVVGTTYVLDHQEELAGFICESFAFQVPAPAIALSIFKLVGTIAPGLPILKLRMKDFTRDPAALAALEADPLTRGETQPARTVRALALADERLAREFSTIALPLMILHGTADKATMYQGSQRFLDQAGSADKTIRLYEGHYHDLLNDIGKEEVAAAITGWIDAHLT